MKHYGRYGFPSDPIVDYSIRLIDIALNIMWNCIDVYTFSWMIDNTCVILSMNVYFDIKRQENILCKIPSDSNTHNIILYWEFSNAVLGHAVPTLPDMNKKTQSYIFTSGSRRLRTPGPLEINMETGVLFYYCHERPSDFNHGMQSFGRSFWMGNIDIDMHYRRSFLFDQPTLLKSSCYFLKQDFKPEICLRVWWGTPE